MKGIKIYVKDGADIRFLRPYIANHLFNIAAIFYYHAPDAYQFVITAGRDDDHGVKSKHYKNTAIDMRVWYITLSGKKYLTQAMLKAIRADLLVLLNDDDYDIVIEYDNDGNLSHMHLEFDP